MKIYCQGKIVPESDAKISVNDHGFLYGASLFETFRTYGGAPLLLEEHLRRLMTGCRAYQIVPHQDLLLSHPPPFAALRQTIKDLLVANNLVDAVFRYTLSAGETAGGLPEGPYQNATEIILVRPLPLARSEEGARLHILGTARTEPEVFPRPKSGHYMNNLAGLHELRQCTSARGDEGLMLTSDGRISEGVFSNVFLVADGILSTPPLSAHILPGITRQAVLDLARNAGIEAAEKNLGLGDLTAAQAIFTTNSLRGLTPVVQVLARSGEKIWQQNSAENGIVKKLLASYAELHL